MSTSAATPELPAGSGRSRRLQIDALFAAALDRPVAERAAFLDEACGGDGALRAEVEELLRLAAEPPGALDSGAAGHGTLLRELFDELETGARAAGAGQRLGRWRLIRELGRGGMGTVYLAERAAGEFEQTAAIKLLQRGQMSDDGMQRFEREGQILASLEHPNIARLIDGGRTEGGRPYLVMEYVVGRRIDDYCAARQLTVDQRIELFIGVAKAVHAAHRSLVVHRDLKPANILVPEDGTPKLLDFGIAKLVEPARGDATLTAPMLGALTPDYASPEQVRGEAITTASDVYQLGLLLFELLTGERAQRVEGTATPGAIERAVCDREPPRPSSAVAAAIGEGRSALARGRSARALRGDLDTIVLRALDKEPSRRYGSAAELVADLERYRRGFPVEARPDTLWYRTSRFVRRHLVGTGAAVLVAALLVGYLLTVAFQQRRIRAEAERAREATAFVTQMFVGFEVGNVGSGRASALDVIDRGARLATSRLAGQPDLQAEILNGFGYTYMRIGRYERAVPHLERSLEIRQARLPASDPRIAETAMLLGMNLHYSSRLHDAEAPLRLARSTYLRAHGPGHSKSCEALTHLGDLLHSRGDLLAAEHELRTAYRECGGILALRDLANVLRDRGDLEDALTAYTTALARFTSDDSGQLGITYQNLGYALTLKGEPGAAGDALEKAGELIAAEFGGDHPVFGTVLRYRGRLALARGDLVESDRLAREALAMQRRWLGDEHHLVLRTLVDRAAVALADRRPVAARRMALESMTRYEELRIPGHPMALEARQIVAAAFLECGDPAAAIRHLRDVISDQEALVVPGDPRLGASLALLAEALRRTGESAEADAVRERAGAVFRRRFGCAILQCRTYGFPLLEATGASCQCP